MRLIALSPFALVGYVVVEGARDYVVGGEAGESTVGIILAGVLLAVLPISAGAQRRTRRELANSVIQATRPSPRGAPIYRRFSSASSS